MGTPTQDQSAALIQMAKILSNSNRVRMLFYLSQNRAMCSSFPRMLKGISQPQSSLNLKKFLEIGLVKKEFVGKTWVYELNQEKWKAIQNLIEVSI
jgi:DNA-binding transcriptional ArsR family regulator